MKLLPLCEFYVRRFCFAQPVGALGLFMSLVLGASASYALWYLGVRNHELSQQLRAARSHHASPVPPPALQAGNVVELPVFSSARFTEQFSAIAKDADMPTEEVFYALEAGPSQPYWRYRITVDVKTGYPELRKFIAALSAALPNISLDTIRCRRENAEDGRLNCQLSFSAFFRKDVRG